MDKDLKINLEKLLSKVLDYVISELLSMLQYSINLNVYEPNHPEVYHRTYDFLRAWIINGSGNIQDLKRSIEYDWRSMQFGSMGIKDYVYHGHTKSGTMVDDRKVLAQWINEGAAGLNAGVTDDFWDMFLRDAEQYIDKFIKDGFAKYGYNVEVKKVG